MNTKKRDLTYFILFLFLSFLIIGYSVNTANYLFLVLLLIIIYFIVTTLNIQQTIILIMLCLMYSLWLLISQYLSLNLTNIVSAVQTRFPSFFELRTKAINYINEMYNFNITASYIKMLLFNVKDEQIQLFYRNTTLMSIAHLFVVGGIHLSLIISIINRLLFLKHIKSLRIQVVLNLIFSLLYGYFLGYSIAIMRIIGSLTVKLITPKSPPLYTNCLSGCFYAIVLNQQVQTFGFLMSYLATIAILIILSFQLSKFVTAIIINLTCIVITLPFVSIMNGKINIFAFIFSFIFSPIILISYLYFFIFSWFSTFVSINDWIVHNLFIIVNFLAQNSVFIYLNNIGNWLYISHFGTLLFLSQHFIKKYFFAKSVF